MLIFKKYINRVLHAETFVSFCITNIKEKQQKDWFVLMSEYVQ